MSPALALLALPLISGGLFAGGAALGADKNEAGDQALRGGITGASIPLGGGVAGGLSSIVHNSTKNKLLKRWSNPALAGLVGGLATGFTVYDALKPEETDYVEKLKQALS